MFVNQRMEYRNDVNQMEEAMQAKNLAVRQLKDGINRGESRTKAKPGEVASKECGAEEQARLNSWLDENGPMTPPSSKPSTLPRTRI